jgi:hypothetical protein
MTKRAETMVSAAQLAADMKCHPRTIRRLCKSGVIVGAQLVGAQWVIPVGSAENHRRTYRPNYRPKSR